MWGKMWDAIHEIQIVFIFQYVSIKIGGRGGISSLVDIARQFRPQCQTLARPVPLNCLDFRRAVANLFGALARGGNRKTAIGPRKPLGAQSLGWRDPGGKSSGTAATVLSPVCGDLAVAFPPLPILAGGGRLNFEPTGTQTCFPLGRSRSWTLCIIDIVLSQSLRAPAR